MNKNKVTFNSLAIEVTRRCNMRCPHCLRGDAEDKDITREVIDSLLDQTQAIYNLVVTGGEPTLNLDIVNYIASGIETREIELFNVSMVTNGLVFDPQIIIAMKHFYRIVMASRLRCGLTPKYEATILGISMDKYHEQQEIVRDNVRIYEKAFRGTVDVAIKQIGNNPIAAGRAKNLPEAKVQSDMLTNLNVIKERRIEVLSKNIKPMCPEYRSLHLLDETQSMICCKMYVTPDGYLMNSCGMDFETEKMFPKICHVSEDIWQAVIKYNDGKTSCAEWEKKYSSNQNVNSLGGVISGESEDYNLSKQQRDDGMMEHIDETDKNRFLHNAIAQMLLNVQDLIIDKTQGIEARATSHDYFGYTEPNTGDYPEYAHCIY